MQERDTEKKGTIQQEDNENKATNSLFPTEMIAKLEWT